MNQPNSGVSGFQKFKLWTCGPIILGGLLLIGAAFVGMVLLLGHDSFHPPMDKKEAANILMQTLRAGNYGKALEILGPYAPENFGGDANKFKQWVEHNHFQPKSWAWTGEKSGRLMPGNREVKSGYTLSGSVVFSDDESGTVEMQLEAFGLEHNPWRVEALKLKRAAKE
jgi:hypothetical protein